MSAAGLAVLLAIGQLPMPRPAGQRCTDCHPAGIAEHLRDWDRSVHATAGVACESCHPPPQPATVPTAGVTWTDQAAVVDLCGRCHTAVAEVFRTSAHYKSTMPSGRRPSCVDCHASAGGQVLAEESFAERCGSCHADDDAPRAGSIAQRGVEVLRQLRRLSLARALVEDEIAQHRRRGGDTTVEATSLRLLTADARDIASEWHRFNLHEAKARSLRALETLESLHHQMQEKNR